MLNFFQFNHQQKRLLLVLFLHITALDLLVFTHQGLLILWQNNLQLKTLAVHLSIITSTFVFFLFVGKLLTPKSSINKKRIGKPVE